MASQEPRLIEVYNRQRRVRFDLAWLRRFSTHALASALPHSADDEQRLASLHEIEVTIISDRRIAQVHRDFLQIGGATDVITFDHGEVVMSADTAQAAASEHGHSVEAELALYTLHGLLHLNGWRDETPREASSMHRVQERLWRACLSQVPFA